MTREEQRQKKAERLAAKIAARNQQKEERREAAAWDRSVKRWKEKGAWVEDENEPINNKP